MHCRQQSLKNIYKAYFEIMNTQLDNKISHDNPANTADDLILSYKERAEKGDTEAQRILANAYYHGIVVEKDKNSALFWLEKAAESGDLRALELLGTAYLKGDILEKDEEKGFHLLIKASVSRSVQVIARLGLCYELGIGVSTDIDKAMLLYTEAESKGSDLAKFRLALIYDQGKYNIEKDLFKAFSYILSLSRAGYPPALEMMGKYCMKGNVIAQNPQRAIKYFELAMQLGRIPSCYYLGKIYGEGKYVAMDKVKAFEYFKKGAAGNYPKAWVSLGLA